MKTNFTQNFTNIVTGHGKTRSYLHRIKIIETPTSTCGTRDQTTEHLLFECELIKKRKGQTKIKRLANKQKRSNNETL